MKTPYQIPLINWLVKVTNDPVVQGASPVNVIGLGSNEDRRNGVAEAAALPKCGLLGGG
jgi:hypothetical protein